MCGRWAGRTQDACDPGYGAAVHGLRDGVYYNTHGCSFRQLPQDLPWLAPFYSELELRFNSIPYVCWSADNWNTALAICAAYLALCFAGPPALRALGLAPLKNKRVLAAWNLLLAAFSLVGFLRTMPHLLYYVLAHPGGVAQGFYASVCRPAETSFGQGASGLWTMLFIFSKVPELVDTVFMVLAQKPVIFLHWYHHFTVLLYCWHSYMTRSSAGLYFIAMNYGVHALMYFYFALVELATTEAAKKSVKVWDIYVTALQISQMVVGVVVCAAVFVFQAGEGGEAACDMTVTNYRAGFTMYASYFVLFALFALEKYVFPNAARDREVARIKVLPADKLREEIAKRGGEAPAGATREELVALRLAQTAAGRAGSGGGKRAASGGAGAGQVAAVAPAPATKAGKAA